MRIAIIGGSGFIGRGLVDSLLSAGHDVVIGDLEPGAHPERTQVLDVRDAQAVTAFVQGADWVYNLAAVHRDDVRPLSLYDEVNVGGAQNICDACRAAGVTQQVFASSVAIYGFPEGVPDEEAPKRPFNDYGRTKLAAEAVYDSWITEDAARTLVIVRPTVVFGRENRGNVYNLMRAIATGPSLMLGDGSNRKSMAYVANVVAFLVWSLDRPTGHHVYNYVDKPDLDMNALVRTIRGALGRRPSPRLRLPYSLAWGIGAALDAAARASGRRFPLSRIRVKKFCSNTRFSSDRMRAHGFRPPVALEDGIADTIRHEFG